MAHRDDLLMNDSYPLNVLHNEEEGKKTRKEIYKVTVLLSIVTLIEVFLGIFIKQNSDLWLLVKWVFVVLTLLKAAYIVMVFMHLGTERKGFQKLILYPYYLLVIYLITILIFEANHQLDRLHIIIF